MDKENSGAKPTLNLAYYVVLVTDVLGQGSRLRELKQLPQSESEFQNTIQVLRDTCAFLMYWRDGFKNYFDLCSSQQARPSSGRGTL